MRLKMRTRTLFLHGQPIRHHECPLPVTPSEHQQVYLLDNLAAAYGATVHYYDRRERTAAYWLKTQLLALWARLTQEIDPEVRYPFGLRKVETNKCQAGS